MGSSKRICPNCNRKMKQQLLGLMHCKCGLSWSKQDGYFERTTDMKFCMERRKVGNKVKQYPYVYGVLQDLSNSDLASRLGVSRPTVQRRLEKLCQKLGVSNKKELRGFLHSYM